MSRRKLSKQQQSRITANQDQVLAVDAESNRNHESYNNCNGRVVSHYGKQLDVESLGGDDALESAGVIVRCHQRANLPELVTGDYVVWEREDAESGVIVAAAERHSVFQRPGFAGKIKPVAANIDRVVIVIATAPEPFMNLIDRYLVAISALNLNALLVMNKTDLIESDNGQAIDSLLSVYEQLNYPVHRVSAQDKSGIDALAAYLQGETTVLVGQSGVGKSSLINCLGGDLLAETGALSAAKYKGTHTTTTAKLFHLAGFDVIDSPGIREFDLGHVTVDEVNTVFPEIVEHSANCKFRDCRHQQEPGCAVQAALEEKQINAERMESYRRIIANLGASQ